MTVTKRHTTGHQEKHWQLIPGLTNHYRAPTVSGSSKKHLLYVALLAIPLYAFCWREPPYSNSLPSNLWAKGDGKILLPVNVYSPVCWLTKWALKLKSQSCLTVLFPILTPTDFPRDRRIGGKERVSHLHDPSSACLKHLGALILESIMIQLSVR